MKGVLGLLLDGNEWVEWKMYIYLVSVLVSLVSIRGLWGRTVCNLLSRCAGSLQAGTRRVLVVHSSLFLLVASHVSILTSNRFSGGSSIW